MPTGTEQAMKVLLVEDDPAYRYLLETELQHSGLLVRAAEDTLKALSLFENEPDIRHVIVDLRMPESVPNGLAFARMARFKRRGTKVALISGVPELLTVAEADEFGGVLAKSDDIAALVGRIRQLLDVDAP